MKNEIINIKGNTYCIDTGMSYIPFYQINDDEIVMLDTGWKDEREILNEVLNKLNVKVVGIINTHSHVDHAGNNAYLKEKYNAVIAMTSHEATICSNSFSLKTYYYNICLEMVESHFKDIICETDIIIGDNWKSVHICGVKFGVVQTPGHSPGHICIITPDNVGYLGDCIISKDVMEGAKMPYAFILKKDLETKKMLHSLKCDKYMLSHRGTFDSIDDLIEENIEFYKSRAEAVKNQIKGKMTREEIMKATMDSFGMFLKPDSIKKFFVMERMIACYIDYLVETGQVGIAIEDNYAKYYLIN